MGEDDGMLRPHGVVPALVTPLTEQGAVDEAALRRVVDHVVGHGVHGVFALGSAGEIYGLGRRERRRVLEVTVDQVGGRVPVYCGASDITTTDCIETVRMAHEVGGVDAFSVLTPYFMTPSQPELVQRFRAIAASTDMPVMLYANPARTHVPISVAATVELAPVHNIGIKDSTGDMALLLQYVQETPDDFTVLVGNDAVVLPGLYLGATGAIASTASALPELAVGLYDAYAAGDHDRARRLQGMLAKVRRLLVGTGTFPITIKETLRLRGIDAGWCLPPARDLPEATRAALPALLDEVEQCLRAGQDPPEEEL